MNGLVQEGDVLIIVPPFARIERPSLGAHVLQACAAAAGHRVRVLYANLLLAARIGVPLYEAISEQQTYTLLGERFFARAAHGSPPFGAPPGGKLDKAAIYQPIKHDIYESETPSDDVEELVRAEALTVSWAEEVAAAIAQLSFRVVGATSTFEQTNASLALLSRVKLARPDIVTILGGANCEGEMAQGLLSLAPSIDYIFSGESEQTFPAFLRTLLGGERPEARIIDGSPCRDLDAIPTPEFSEYFEQRERVTPAFRPARTYIPYESSRGCWWGQKHHCTFCGLNGQGMVFREKSPERVIADLRSLSAAHGTNHFCLTDNIMPHSYFKTLLPKLAQENVELFYEQKANLSLDDVLALKRSGINVIQPGIEALSTLLLRRMDKGVQGRQNVSLLRYARAAGMDVQWNLLWGFPGDEPEAYEETLAMVPLLGHLQPPTGLVHLGIDRFSPYFDRAARYGITNLRAHPIYARAFPAHADLQKIAYRFVGDYACGAHRSMDVVTALGRAVAGWRARWESEHPPTLRVNRFDELFILRDTRGLAGTRDHLVLDRDQAFDVLSPRPYTSAAAPWVEQKLGIHLDGWYVPLATATPALLVELEQRARDVKKPRKNHLPMFAHTP